MRHRCGVRTLKLQMQITVDGFVAGPQGQLVKSQPGQDSII